MCRECYLPDWRHSPFDYTVEQNSCLVDNVNIEIRCMFVT
jgi:hypothetical protein